MVYGCIYKIENLVNGKLYVGQTTQPVEKRAESHFHDLRKGIHHNQYLQNSFNKYGENSFEVNIIKYTYSKKELDDYEKYFIDKYDSCDHNKGYNLKYGGSNGKHIFETKKKISDTLKSKTKEEHPCYGKTPKISTRSKISNSMRGKGLFGFSGAYLNKKANPENKCWQSRVYYNGTLKSLGTFIDPLSAEFMYSFVKDEIIYSEIQEPFENVTLNVSDNDDTVLGKNLGKLMCLDNNRIKGTGTFITTLKDSNIKSVLDGMGLPKAWFLVNGDGLVEDIKLV